jgi:LacI family transcriptional regulator
MALSMKDIAQDLGVSLVTVSKALRDHPDISKKTKARVFARCEELGYSPNLAARSLVTGRSSLVGLIVPDLVHPFFAEVSKALSRVLREHEYFAVISSSESDPLLEQQETKQMLAHRLDALVIASCQLEPTSLQQLQSRGTPLILFDRYFEGFPCNFVGTNDYSAGKLAAEHLVSMKCKRIAHIRGPLTSAGKGRLKGFTDTLAKYKIHLPPEYLIAVRDADVDGAMYGAKGLHILTNLSTPPDGVFCYNDVVAMGLLVEAVKQGIRIPEDLAVVGCGNLHFDDALRVPLSSVDQRAAELGVRTAKLILDLLNPDSTKAQKSGTRKIILQPRLVARASSDRLVSNYRGKKRAAGY